ncbi:MULTISPECIES: hypothetical protein [Dietzia]|uniref:hypothetical protein n=1 Tax=Dietzia TaxID=37914 RepID=UPI000D61F3DE|nr:hypothetical protein [Dietzia cercidiphylli]MCT1514862.1 hypothetical protein [Dietzia cercidiphylli]PWD95440.1 hypothetical protein DEQ16_10605 [Dietzia maris]
MSTSTVTPHTGWPRAILIGVLGSFVVGIVVLAFLWPAKTSTPQHLPVSISGPAETVSALESALAEKAPDTFDFVDADDRDDAVSQIEQRETYGAIILDETPGTAPEVLTAPAGSAVATQMLGQVATQLQAQLTQAVTAAGGDPTTAVVTVTPVVPLSDSDPTGTGLAAASFPLTIGGMLGGVLIALGVAGAIRRLVALAGFGTGVGIVLTLMLHTWFEYIPGDFWLNALAISLSITATAAFIVGCSSLLGRAGIGVAAVLTMFVGNPLSAAATPWQFLPEPWGIIGQFFVPGASNSLIRTVSYFPHADASAQWWILLGWTALGVILTIAGHYRSRTTVSTTREAPALDV